MQLPLDATEPRLEHEQCPADNLMAVANSLQQDVSPAAPERPPTLALQATIISDDITPSDDGPDPLSVMTIHPLMMVPIPGTGSSHVKSLWLAA